MQLLKVFYTEAQKNLLQFVFFVDTNGENTLELQLPAWRPGRYELQNFAKNIQHFAILGQENEPVAYTKISKDRWKIHSKGHQKIAIHYTYYAVQMDGGGTYLDEDLCYINWITCAMYIEGRQNEAYQVELQVPNTYQIACGMQYIRTENAAIFSADSFYKLTAAPMLASPTLQELTYQIENLTTVFHIWIQGKWQPDTEEIIADFQAFTTKQVEIFAQNSNMETAFPATDYHFIFIILPYYYHHGVEHYNSTMLVMGVPPNYDFHSQQYKEVLSISSHELFHFWNICRIRPVEMLPYDYTKENYFPTGFVAEGITTYYGDYMLLRSGIWNFAEYSKSFEQLLQRHFDNFGRYAYSLAASSWDLWLDGYVAGIPNRKVSIYNEGALAAWILDIEIRFLSNNTKSLDEVLRILWNDFALQNRGYSLQDYQNIVEQVAGKSMQKYFDDCILGVGKIEHYLQATIQHIGYQILANKNPRIEEQVFGFRIVVRESKLFVGLIAPNSPADEFLSLQDELLSIDNQVVEPRFIQTLLQGKKEITLQIIRKQKLKIIRLQANTQQYLPIYSLEKLQNSTEKQTNCLIKWLA